MDLMGASDLTALRDLSLSALPDTGSVTRPAASGTLSAAGDWSPAAASSIYTGSLRVKAATMQERASVFGDSEVSERSYMCTLPHTAPDLEVGDRIQLTDSSDPQITASMFRVVVVIEQSYHVHRKVGLEVVE